MNIKGREGQMLICKRKHLISCPLNYIACVFLAIEGIIMLNLSKDKENIDYGIIRDKKKY